MATRSIKLAAAHVATTGWTTLYRAPLDRVVLLKTFALTSWATAAGQIVLQLTAGPDPAQVRLFNEPLSNSDFRIQELWLVLEPGDEISCFLGAAPVDFVLSGAELPDRPLVP